VAALVKDLLEGTCHGALAGGAEACVVGGGKKGGRGVRSDNLTIEEANCGRSGKAVDELPFKACEVDSPVNQITQPRCPSRLSLSSRVTVASWPRMLVLLPTVVVSSKA
jgi:hypothetical protein